MGIFRLTYHNTEQSPLCLSPRSTKNHDQCIMMRLFIYFFIFGSFFFFFPLFSPRGQGCGRYTRRAGCGAVLAYMCYSCSNIVVVSIHIHAFKKAGCVHRSIVSPIMFPPYSNHRQGDSITSARAALDMCVYVCVCVCVCLYRRMPPTQGSLLFMMSF